MFNPGSAVAGRGGQGNTYGLLELGESVGSKIVRVTWFFSPFPALKNSLSNQYTPSPSHVQISRSILNPHEDDHVRATREICQVKQVVSEEVLQTSFIHPT